MILMCKNKAVYDIETQTVCNSELLPGAMRNFANTDTFKYWMKKRYSQGTNSLSRQLRGLVFGQGNRILIDKTTRAFSLSDCYWLKDPEDSVLFEENSPYYADFWKGGREYKGEAVPTLYVGGAQNKEWLDRDRLFKKGCFIEAECYELCQFLGVDCNVVEKNEIGIIVQNFTSADVMLEQADMSGKFDEDEYVDEDILREFGWHGCEMLVIDAIIGNGDRHLGNFGYLRNSNTGEYLGMSPLYDFDHALDAQGDKDILLSGVIQAYKNNPEWQASIVKLLEKAQVFGINEIFRKRADVMLTAIMSLDER